MNKNKMLFELLAELIDVQIKKYVSLASRGVGPDARLNAALVYDEVKELLFFANLLLDEIQSNVDADRIDYTVFYTIFDQVKFYLEQEQLRAYAGRLLDDNNIHATVDERTSKQLHALAEIAEHADIDLSVASQPVTEIQKQCQYDSAKIACFILTLAKSVRENPSMVFDPKVPEHAQVILRRNALTRYHELANEIDELHQQCEEVLEGLPLKARFSSLTKEEAWARSAEHKGQLTTLLKRYQGLTPDSCLFTSKHTWHEVASFSTKAGSEQSNKQVSLQSFFSNRRALLGGVAVAGIYVAALLYYFSTQFEEGYTAPKL
ncbi:hypothetical protein [Legionella jamestowniensis]|uniref:Uncharacterized protein n=1 Tax=Legionella jamestowniensis TaxID=455 RepID=A0A0W0UH15_9GAMM|nr:hypothetical protein [Legionella jamestowniensis]KTD06925.1 hypothetical protein Ljam_1120 [Legionella jamestowniensis]SFL85028.1 hypothetical protein SAMN02746073_2248 [Legionella jamestowniensis DSM 19215]